MNRHLIARIVVGVAMIAALAACSSDDETITEGGDSGPIQVSEIIVNPKAPAPGDTVFLTVILSGSSAPGDYPAISWSSDNDSFLEKNLLTVRWMAPAGGVYEITASAANDANSASRSRKVFVGEPNRVHGPAGEFHLMPNELDFYFLDFSSFFSPSTGRANYVRFFDESAGTANPVSLEQLGGNSYAFSRDLTRSAYSFTWFNFNVAPGPFADVYVNNHDDETTDKLTFDRTPFATSPRRNFYLDPHFSWDSQKLAMTGFLPYRFPSGPDTFDVFVHDFTTGETVDITETHGIVRSNVMARFSTDGNWLTFISDREKLSSWEIYGLPITGGVIATDSASTVKLTNTGGIIASGIVANLSTPLIEWSHEPTVSTAGIVVAGDGSFRLFSTNPTGATLLEVPDVEGGREMVWSPDGTLIAVAGARIVWIVTMGGAATVAVELPTGDQIGDVAWSNDQEWMVYRVIRGALSWFELLDIDGGEYDEPIIITNSVSPGQVVSLRNAMKTRGTITTDNRVYFLQFEDATDFSPDIWSLDINPVVNP